MVSARPTAVNMKLAADKLIHLANKLSKDETVNVVEMKGRYVSLAPRSGWVVGSMSLPLVMGFAGFSML